MPVNFNQDESLQFPRLSKTVMESVRFSKGPQKLWPVEYKHSEFFSDSGAFLNLGNRLPFDKRSALCSALQNAISWRIFQPFHSIFTSTCLLSSSFLHHLPDFCFTEWKPSHLEAFTRDAGIF